MRNINIMGKFCISGNLETFIEIAREVHGVKYDYSKVNYKGTKTKVTIICPKHGEFEQTPYRHLKGQGCIKCGHEKIKEKNGLSQEEWIKRAREMHGNKYDYSKVDYINANEKVCIICPKHGEFWQNARNHIRGLGCPKCGERFLDKEFFIEKAKKVHGNRYDYSKVNYVNNRTKITIICPEHGEFEQTPNSHLCGKGCQICSEEIRCNKRRKNVDELIREFNEIHHNKYDYSLIKEHYKNATTKIPIICPEHGIFWQTSINHRYSSCPNCSESKGEKELSYLLAKRNIKFTRQKTFDWLKYRRKQKLDIYLNDYNIAIEYQGMQHFRPVYWTAYGEEKAQEGFEQVQKYDKNKKDLCDAHGVKLYYINYNDYLEKRLNEILNENHILW